MTDIEQPARISGESGPDYTKRLIHAAAEMARFTGRTIQVGVGDLSFILSPDGVAVEGEGA